MAFFPTHLELIFILYASIQHNILIEQIHQHFADPRVLFYLENIITIVIDDGGNILLPTQGIPRRSSLSPFFGAVERQWSKGVELSVLLVSQPH